MECTLEPNVEIALAAKCCKNFKGAALDGRFLYLTLPQEHKIYKFNRDFIFVKCYDVKRPYNAICYDSTEDCFWASDKKNTNIIFKLDRCLEEIGCIKMDEWGTPCSEIAGLSYNCDTNTIFLAFTNFIAELSKSGRIIGILQRVSNGSYSSVLAIPPYYIVIRLDDCEQNLDLFTQDGCLIRSFRFSCNYLVEDIVFDPCSSKKEDTLDFIILTADCHCCPRLLKWSMDSCEKELFSCNFKCCCHCCDCDKDRDRCLCDLIESIALVETALSHILNAEGEKIQEAVEIASSVEELLAVNQSVNKTITNVTFLEQALYAKLEALKCLELEK